MTEKKIFEEDMLPVAMEHSERKTYTQRRTPTHDALSILKKMDQSHTREDKHTYTCMYIRTRSINHCPITESNEAAASFKSITASVIALGLCVCVCVSAFVSFPSYVLSIFRKEKGAILQEQHCSSICSFRTG